MEESRRRLETLKQELEELLAREELLWQQRGKALWLKAGDRNTVFFPLKLQNAIKCLKDEQSFCHTSNLAIQSLIQDYFRGIFTSTTPTPSVIDECLTCLSPIVSDEVNDALLHPYTTDEVRRTLNQMHPLKSPVPDGMCPGCFQRFWSFVGSDTTSCVLHFLNERSLHPCLNTTNIVLLPKSANPKTILDFRPISLCNIVYKITSKAIANPLKPILYDIISPAQSPFISGCLITDNVLIAHEINHFLANKYWGKTCHVSLKLDISKAYDRVERSFLERVLYRLGYHDKRVRLIMTCASTISCSFLLNGVRFGSLHPERGIQ
ncbi:UNVERIFIED_CONTAM: hypothetical protein Slati_2363500 [Sesamum latifolium]|uniref:Reverse transcriptase domain-containing protein n=1 Tax=Sesamum latifolium TaxID=2727402 RepID=A0AAW2WAN0_9LAMI